jgi:hypothetical protein
LLCRVTEPSDTVGIFWAGVGPYYCQRTYVDLLGKSDRRIARQPIRTPRLYPGHSKWDWDYIVGEVRPNILLTDTPELRARHDYLDAYCRWESELVLVARRDWTTRSFSGRLCELVPQVECQPCAVSHADVLR